MPMQEIPDPTVGAWQREQILVHGMTADLIYMHT
jgi:hypothetical protein